MILSTKFYDFEHDGTSQTSFVFNFIHATILLKIPSEKGGPVFCETRQPPINITRQYRPLPHPYQVIPDLAGEGGHLVKVHPHPDLACCGVGEEEGVGVGLPSQDTLLATQLVLVQLRLTFPLVNRRKPSLNTTYVVCKYTHMVQIDKTNKRQKHRY